MIGRSSAMSLEARQAMLVLVSLPRMGPARLQWANAQLDPAGVLAALRSGTPPTKQRAPRGVNDDLMNLWFSQARSLHTGELWSKYVDAGVSLLFPGDDAWPFNDDPEPPPLLFFQGNLAALESRGLAGVVGTRRCSALGRQVARTMGHELAANGIGVVSGLALGVDGAAHSGAVAAGGAMPVAVVGTGLDHVYPRANRALWEQIAEEGLLLSEAPLGAGPERWRFPARNRLLAGLVDVLVVVESHQKGGALLTVGEAADRGTPVVAVPGSVLARSCEGSNLLLVEGCAPVRHANDVLDILGLSPAQTFAADSATDGEAGTLEHRLLHTLAAGGTHINTLIAELETPAAPLLSALQTLVSDGRVAIDGSTALLVEYPPPS